MSIYNVDYNIDFDVDFEMPKNRTMLIRHLTFPDTMLIFDIEESH